MKSEQAIYVHADLQSNFVLLHEIDVYRRTIQRNDRSTYNHQPQPTHLRVGPTQCGSHIPMCGTRIYLRGLELEFLAVVVCVALLAKHIEST